MLVNHHQLSETKVLAMTKFTEAFAGMRANDRELVVGQACYLCSDFEDGTLPGDNIHDESWADTAADSLRRLTSLDAAAAHFSHDPRPYARLTVQSRRQGV